MSYISPGFPASGGDSGPMVIEPDGRIDVLYQGYHITNTTTYAMDPAYSYFTSSTDGGKTWSTPVKLGPNNGTMSLAEWWIDGDIASTPPATSTQPGTPRAPILMAAPTTSAGSPSPPTTATWSEPVQVPPDQLNVPHIMEVAGGGRGIAYVGFFRTANPAGYAEYLRTFSVTQGWLAAPVQVSNRVRRHLRLAW